MEAQKWLAVATRSRYSKLCESKISEERGRGWWGNTDPEGGVSSIIHERERVGRGSLCEVCCNSDGLDVSNRSPRRKKGANAETHLIGRGSWGAFRDSAGGIS